MSAEKALRFAARVTKLGINPLVDVPGRIVSSLLAVSGKRSGPIPVKGHLSGAPFKANVVRYLGEWRLYLNTTMRDAAGVGVGDRVRVELEYDREERVTPMPPAFAAALAKDRRARAAFEKLTPSHRKDILNYLNSLKTQESLGRNITRAIAESLSGARRYRASR